LNTKVEYKRRKRAKKSQKINRQILKRQKKWAQVKLRILRQLRISRLRAVRQNEDDWASVNAEWQRRLDEVNLKLKVTDPPRAIESWCEMVGTEYRDPHPVTWLSPGLLLRSWSRMLELDRQKK